MKTWCVLDLVSLAWEEARLPVKIPYKPIIFTSQKRISSYHSWPDLETGQNEPVPMPFLMIRRNLLNSRRHSRSARVGCTWTEGFSRSSGLEMTPRCTGIVVHRTLGLVYRWWSSTTLESHLMSISRAGEVSDWCWISFCDDWLHWLGSGRSMEASLWNSRYTLSTLVDDTSNSNLSLVMHLLFPFCFCLFSGFHGVQVLGWSAMVDYYLTDLHR
jgi:hypothetical protein